MKNLALASMVAIGSLLLCPLLRSKRQRPAAAPPVVYLDQAWSQEDREWYYNFSQGSAVISYDIFLNLEVPGSEELFRSDANSERLGLIPQPANPNSNPDGLPIGVSKTNVATPIKGWPAGDYAGPDLCRLSRSTVELQGHADPHTWWGLDHHQHEGDCDLVK